MRTKPLLLSTIFFAAALAGCIPDNVRHGWVMRGQVLTLENSVATVCIGTRDGAKVGQVLDVQHITSRPSGNAHDGVVFTRTDAGRVKITELFDEHYARAQVVSGAPAVNDIVELAL